VESIQFNKISRLTDLINPK